MNWPLLLAALIQVESGGDVRAIGDGGRAVGCLQIHPCVVVDVNRIYGQEYTLADRFDERKSRRMALLYLAHYGARHERRTGEPLSPQVAARIWNGGPQGYRKSATEPYWVKVSACLEE